MVHRPPRAAQPPSPQTRSLETGKFRPKAVVNKAELKRRAADRRRFALRIGAYVAGGLALAAAAVVFLRPRTGCRETPVREQALAVLLEWKDPVTGQPLGEQFAGSRFNGSESISPAGVLVATVDSAQPPIIWWVDEQRRLHNVNLLAAAYTPQLPGAPAFEKSQLRSVGRAPEE